MNKRHTRPILAQKSVQATENNNSSRSKINYNNIEQNVNKSSSYT